MLEQALRDLDLAGVRWELRGDTPATDGVTENAAGNPTPAGPVPVPARAPVTVDMAVAAAAGAGDMPALMAAVRAFNHPLCAGAACAPMDLPTGSRDIVIVTDMPGADDAAAGHMCAGAAGDLLDKMLGAIGLSRDTAPIVPLLFWRTPGGRTPLDDELALARPFVDRAIELLRPRVVLTLGTMAADKMAGVTLPDGHGQWVMRDTYRVMPIYHPNFLLLKTAAKRDAWSALQDVQNLLKTSEK